MIMRSLLVAVFIGLFVNANFVQAKTYRCSGIFHIHSSSGVLFQNEEISDMVVKTQDNVAMVMLGNQEPYLYELVKTTKTGDFIYHRYSEGWRQLHTIFISNSPLGTYVYYTNIDRYGMRNSYDYKCSN